MKQLYLDHKISNKDFMSKFNHVVKEQNDLFLMSSTNRFARIKMIVPCMDEEELSMELEKTRRKRKALKNETKQQLIHKESNRTSEPK